MKNTFAAKTFAAKHFASGLWCGLGVDSLAVNIVMTTTVVEYGASNGIIKTTVAATYIAADAADVNIATSTQLMEVG